MIRSAFLVSISVAITAFISFFVVVLALFGVGENSLHKVARLWATLVLKVSGVDVETIGLEKCIERKAADIYVESPE